MSERPSGHVSPERTAEVYGHLTQSPENDTSVAALTRGERDTLESYLVALWQCDTERGYREFAGRVLAYVEQVKTAGALIAADDARVIPPVVGAE